MAEEAEVLDGEEESQYPPGTIVSELPDDDAPEPTPHADISVGDGKSVADILREVDALRTGLKLSESARIALEGTVRQGLDRQPAPAAAPAYVEPAPPWGRLLQDADFEAIAEKDGMVAAQKAMITQNNWLLEQQYNRRAASMNSSGMSQAELLARREYPDEFELFDADIKALIASLPDKAVMTTMEGWENAISYVRGRKGNIQKYIDHLKTKGDPTPSLASAQAEQADMMGFTPAPMRSAPTSAGRAPVLDPVTREIAREFVRQGVYASEAEYARDYASVNGRK